MEVDTLRIVGYSVGFINLVAIFAIIFYVISNHQKQESQ